MKAALIPIVIAATTGFALASPAFAQLPQPRCSGFPPPRANPGPSGPGLIINAPGVKCYGQLLNQVGGTLELAGMRVVQGPSNGRFIVTGTRQFEFTQGPNASGWHNVVLEIDWRRGSTITHDTRAYRITTPDDYKRAGGTNTRPPPRFFQR